MLRHEGPYLQHCLLVTHMLSLTFNSCLRSCRYDEIVKGPTPFLKQCGFNPKKDLTLIPVSALRGTNMLFLTFKPPVAGMTRS
jgi:translation elongation factor EF-1alpha